MKRFGVLLGIMIVCSIAFVATPGGQETILGLRVVDTEATAPAWIGVGGPAVIVIGGGFGVVAFTLYGAGILFATGQLAIGMICIAQLGLGLVFALVQVGAGLTGLGQGMIGGLVHSDGGLGFDGDDFLDALNQDVENALRIRRT